MLHRGRQERPRRGLRLRRHARRPYKDPAAAKPTFDDAQIDGLLDKLGATAPDPKTLVVKLDTPINFFNNIMAMWLMTPTNEKSTKFAEAADLIASGPFMIDSWAHNSEMTLVPNPNWAGAKPTLTKLVHDLRWRPRGRRCRLREWRPRPGPRPGHQRRGAWSTTRT